MSDEILRATELTGVFGRSELDKLQEVFGWTRTPMILDGQLPVTLHLLSPAQRPVQVTRDLAGFWQSSYFEVRKELRGRYPRHPWPEDPLTAPATRRAKPRGT